MSNPSASAQKLSCPNCGAPGELPASGNAMQCEYCGARYFLPAAHASLAPPPEIRAQTATLAAQDSANVRRWLKWLVIFIIVVTVVPMLCGIAASACGVLGAFAPLFAR